MWLWQLHCQFDLNPLLFGAIERTVRPRLDHNSSRRTGWGKTTAWRIIPRLRAAGFSPHIDLHPLPLGEIERHLLALDIERVLAGRDRQDRSEGRDIADQRA